jgi:hypothetical protein
MAGSGYNQDSNQLTASLYRVTVDMSSSTNYPVATGNTASGGLWPYDWTNPVYTNATSMTAAQALVLAQGNLRWQRVLDSLDNIADCRILNVSVTAANGSGLTTDATNQPTALNFTVEFYRDSFIVGEWNNYLKSIGQSSSGTYTNNDGTTGTAYIGIGGTAVTTTALAIRDIVTSGILSNVTRFWRVWSPTQYGDTEVKVAITQPNATASNIFATVACSGAIAGTTLTGSPL